MITIRQEVVWESNHGTGSFDRNIYVGVDDVTLAGSAEEQKTVFDGRAVQHCRRGDGVCY
jgi:hypothetical protein